MTSQLNISEKNKCLTLDIFFSLFSNTEPMWFFLVAADGFRLISCNSAPTPVPLLCLITNSMSSFHKISPRFSCSFIRDFSISSQLRVPKNRDANSYDQVEMQVASSKSSILEVENDHNRPNKTTVFWSHRFEPLACRTLHLSFPPHSVLRPYL